MTVLVSREAPDFTAPAVMPDNTINSSFRLSDYKGKPIVLFFWPLDFSFVCPTEIIAHDRRLDAFNKRGIQVIGVSVDSQYTHLAWKKTPRTKGGIGPVRFPLVADVNHEITQKYGIEHPDGVALRATFLIDPDGIVQSQIINNLNLGRNVDEILRMADAQAKENAKLKSAFENGDIADLGSLTVKQLQTLAKQNGVAIARTKADFIKLLDLAEPGIDHGDLAGAALSAKLKEHKIGLLRTKEELVELLGLKQAELKQAKLLAAQMAKIPPAEGLEGMTAQQLKEMAKENGISLNMTKQETIELLDKLEPGVDHSGLMGKELAAAKQKHGIGILKNKQQLVEALIRLATEETLRKWILRQIRDR